MNHLYQRIGATATCAKDPRCFGGKYVCAGCCATGKTTDGRSCWSGWRYTKSRCCNELTSLAMSATFITATHNVANDTSPTTFPTFVPTNATDYNSSTPTVLPTQSPTYIPTRSPTNSSTPVPTPTPTQPPTLYPTTEHSSPGLAKALERCSLFMNDTLNMSTIMDVNGADITHGTTHYLHFCSHAFILVKCRWSSCKAC